MLKKLKYFSPVILSICMVWTSISLTIQRFKCPTMTETELFLNIPKSFILNFNC